jgi:hypothetical protein
MAMRTGVCLIVLLIVLLSAAPSFSAMTLHVTTSDDGVYILDGNNVTGVEAVDITINYDATSLANPRVLIQGGTLTDVSAPAPGMLTVKVFRPDTDMMFQLQLTFEKRGDSPGGITNVATTVMDTAGRSYDVPANIYHLTPPPAAQSDSKAAADFSSGGIDKIHPKRGTAHLTKREKSILQRFEEFRGTKGLKEFAALFERLDLKGTAQEMMCNESQCQILFDRLDPEKIAQEPAIALSDGKTPVTIKLELEEAEEGHPPDFAMLDAELVSLQKTGEKRWVITAMPIKGTWEANLIVRRGMKTLEFPLVVAPPVKIQDDISERNFLFALDTYLTDQAAEHTAEGRPFRKFVHEYIFTANYLVKRVTKILKQSAR